MFGGWVSIPGYSAAGEAGDLWEWDGSHWTQLQGAGPKPRTQATMAYDPVSKRAMLFGGAVFDPAAGTLSAPIRQSDTWAWDGSQWTQLDAAGPLSASNWSSPFETMAFDPVSQSMLLVTADPWDAAHRSQT